MIDLYGVFFFFCFFFIAYMNLEANGLRFHLPTNRAMY